MAFSNTVSLNTNFNVDPYYDDFNESDNYYRMLFRPGFGVQARELTQMQTMLQNQIDRFGEHIFREGSVVSGCEYNYLKGIDYVKIRDNNSANTASVNAISFIGQTVTGATTGITANVYFAITGSEANDPNLKTLYVQYLSTSANGTGKAFSAGEILNVASGLTCNVATTNQSANPVGRGSLFSIGEGVVFAKDHFIRVNPQKIVVSRYNTGANTRIGFTITETIVDSETDSQLTDPATGSYNYAAPGANRLKLEPILRTQPVSNTATTDFIEITQVNNGNLLSYKEKPRYAEIRDYLAERTFDESGNYTVRGLQVRLREHLKTANNGGVFSVADGGNNSTLSVDVSPGKAYVRGFDVETLKTAHVQIDKGIDFVDLEDVTVTSQYGNYVTVNEVAGAWDVNLHANVSIRNTAANAVSNGDYSVTSAVGSEIGTARVRAITHDSGTPGAPSATYRLYLYDIQMSGADFADARSFYYDSSSLSDSKADAVLSSGNAVLNETSFKKAVFPTGYNAIRRIKDSTGASDTDYEFMRVFEGLTMANSGIVTATSPNSDEIFPYTAGSTVSSPNEKFYLVFDAAANTVNYAGTVTIADGGNTVSGTSTNFTDVLNIGDTIKLGGYANTFTVSEITNDASLKVLETALAAATGVEYFKNFAVGKVVPLSGVGADTEAGSGASRTVTIGTPATSATIDIKEPLNSPAQVTLVTSLTKANATQIAKTLKIKRRVQITANSNPGSTSGPWSLGFPDVLRITSVRVKNASSFSSLTDGTDYTDQFELDNGQRDGFYGLASLKLKSTSTLTISAGDNILVSLDYFEHDRSSGVGFLTVDSYPVNDVSPSNTEIYTQQIPRYKSPTDGQLIDLRNSIDYRPVVSLTATDTTTLGSMSTDPANSHVISSTSITSGQGLRFPRPNENATVDLSFYQGRNDLIILQASGDLRAIRGTPSGDPKYPVEPGDGMLIGKVQVSPFPSLPPQQAKASSRPDLQSDIIPVKNKRYTMKDIGQIANRIDRLEYYTSLNLLEKSAADLFIADGSGNDRFKNGILVDRFGGHGVGDVTNLDYAIAMDRSKSEARPSIKNREVQLQFDPSSSTNTVDKPSDVRLTFTGATTTYSNGETITVGAASGTLKYQVGSRLYLENTTGTFSTGTQAVGSVSSANQTVTAVQTVGAGKAVTLPYTHTEFGAQPTATTTRNAAGAFYKWVGNVTLNPSQDYWVDTTRNPDVQVNFDLQNDNFLETINPFETEFAFDETLVWGSQTFVTGINTRQPNGNAPDLAGFTTQTNQQGLNLAIGMNSQIVPLTDTQSLGERVVDVNVVPFIRERLIQVTGTGFKPNARLFSFFDGEDVTEYVTPMNSTFTANTGTEGSALFSDSDGFVFAEFRIPNDDALRFRIGERRFRLTDSSTNSNEFGNVTTSGEAVYAAQGLQTTVENTIVSIETSEVVQDLVVEASTVTNVIDRRTVDFPIPEDTDRNGPDEDPIAQTFSVKDYRNVGQSVLSLPGIFLSKIDLYFATKDPNFGCDIEIRAVDPTTSYITPKRLPFGRVRLSSSDINLSDDGSAPTPVIFPTPVFLRNDIQYAIVIKPEGNNPNTTVFTARLGETDLVTGNRVTKQPAVGTLFASANDLSYTPISAEDLKFRLYRATFSETSGTALFNNANREFFTVANISSGFTSAGEIVHGETTLTLGTTVTANVGETANGVTSGATFDVRTNATVATNAINVIGTSNNSLTPTPFTPTETIRFYFANGDFTGQSSTLSSQSTPTGRVHLYDPRTSANTVLVLSNTSGTFVENTVLKGQVTGAFARIASIDNLIVHRVHPHIDYLQPLGTTYTANGKFALTSASLDTKFRALNINESFDFDGQRLVLSRSNEISGLSSAKSAQITTELGTSINSLSPIIHLDRSTLSLTRNYINNDSTSEDGISGGNAQARYITRVVTLADGQDAEDLKVYIAGYKPSSGTIEVYYKILNDSDEGPIELRNWSQMTQVTSTATNSSDINKQDFKEFEFTIPTADKTGSGGEVQYSVGGVTYTGFKRFAVKIVLLTSNAANPPRLKDFRAIALQI